MVEIPVVDDNLQTERHLTPNPEQTARLSCDRGKQPTGRRLTNWPRRSARRWSSMDVGMARMDGVEATRRIRALCRLRS